MCDGKCILCVCVMVLSPPPCTFWWMNDCCFRPRICTFKAILGQGQPGLITHPDVCSDCCCVPPPWLTLKSAVTVVVSSSLSSSWLRACDARRITRDRIMADGRLFVQRDLLASSGVTMYIHGRVVRCLLNCFSTAANSSSAAYMLLSYVLPQSVNNVSYPRFIYLYVIVYSHDSAL